MNFPPETLVALQQSTIIRELLENHTITLDNTEFTTWNACFVKGLYWGGLRRVSVSGQTPLIFGSCVHTGLKLLLTGSSLKDATAAALAEASRDSLDSYLDAKRNTTVLVDILDSYHSHVKILPSERLLPVQLDGKLVVEQNFNIPLGDLHFAAGDLWFQEPTTIKVNWTGIIDLLIAVDNKIWIVDHKTTSVMGDKFADDKQRSSQMLGYTHVARLIAERLGMPIAGVVINALAMRSAGFEFKQFKLPMASWRTTEWHTETLAAVAQLIRQLYDFIATQIAVPNRESCVTKYGKCPYFDLCEMVPSSRHSFIANDAFFKSNVWNPVA